MASASGTINLIPVYIKDLYNSTPISVSYSTSGLTSVSWFAAWNGYQLRAVAPSVAQKSLGDALPIFKCLSVGIGNVTTNASGYADISNNANKPDNPAGYSLFFVGLRSWTATSPVGAFTVSSLGQYVIGAPSMTITNLRLDYYFVLSNDLSTSS